MFVKSACCVFSLDLSASSCLGRVCVCLCLRESFEDANICCGSPVKHFSGAVATLTSALILNTSVEQLWSG